jgi:hypothetical protein
MDDLHGPIAEGSRYARKQSEAFGIIRHTSSGTNLMSGIRPAAKCFFGLVGLCCGRAFATALFVGPLSPALGTEALFSQTAGATCQRFYEPRAIATHCRGPAGYVAVIVDRDRVMNINYGRVSPLGRGLDRSDLLWRGAARQVDDRIEWRVLRGQPFAAIVRIFMLTDKYAPVREKRPRLTSEGMFDEPEISKRKPLL